MYGELQGIDPSWTGLKQAIKVQRTGKRNGAQYEETAYYITSLETNASYAYGLVRSHWAIENSLHYIKDVSMGEDRSRIRTANAPGNFALMRSLALNVMKRAKFQNIAQAKRMLANDIHGIIKILI